MMYYVFYNFFLYFIIFDVSTSKLLKNIIKNTNFMFFLSEIHPKTEVIALPDINAIIKFEF
jgi:hypothetical protein